MRSTIKGLDPKIYDKNYYLSVCLGNEEFTKSQGKKLHPRIKLLIKKLKLTKHMTVLDIGCGRGDVILHVASKVEKAYGIDYSKDAISLATSALKRFPINIRKTTEFSVMNIKKLHFPSNTFDLIICIDVFEHLYKEEVEIAMKEIKRVLKPGGVLFVHTGTNKILNDYIYKYYTYYMNLILTWADKKIKNVSYDPLPKDPRTKEEKEQHINEPTYFYLSSLFKRFKFDGNIECEIGYIKEKKQGKTFLYNFLIAFYPLSKLFPLNTLFAWVFICTMKNNKI